MKCKHLKSMKKKACMFLAASLLAAGMDMGAGNASVADAAPQAREREVLNFNTDWLYSSVDYENGEAAWLDDSSFEAVSVPHANTVLQSHKGDGFPGEIASYRFVSWYRRHFTLPQSYAGRNIRVDFEGVATVADVYLNGQLLGSHKGAYTGFTVDITDAVYTDGRENVLAVRVDSQRQPQIPPEGGSVDYCLFGGIVRDVTMTVTEPAYIERVFVTTPEVQNGNGMVKNSVDIQNKSGEAKSYAVEMSVLDAGGNTVASSSGQAQVAAASQATVELQTGAVANPHLWDVEDPYLYTAVTKIKDGETEVDSYSTRFGMRYFSFAQGPEDGSFYLNGRKMEIAGINRHEQWPWIGRAVPDKLQEQDADLIKATGIDAVRCSHYPQDPSFLDRCDEIGLLVFAEAPGWQHIGDDGWKAEFKNNLTELILRDRNHPSIISWSTRPNESRTDTAFNQECKDLILQLDATRPVHGVRWEFALPGEPSGNHIAADDNVVDDILTVNYRYPENPPHIPYMVTEHSNDWWGDGMSWAPDENANKFIDSFAEPLDYFYRNDKVAGGFGWSMFDYNNEVNYTRSGHVFYSGLYDLFRHEKPVAYLYKAQQDIAKAGTIVYISNNWTSNTSSTVYVMSNCEEVELFVNGVSKGRTKGNKYTSLPHPIFSFEGISYEAGELKAVGYQNGTAAGECVRKTPGAAVRLVAEPDYGTLTADGADMTSVSVTAVDAEGNPVPFASNRVNVAQAGGVAATLISERNAELEDGKIAFLVQSVRDSVGTASFTVTSEGLEAASVNINIEPFAADRLVPASKATGLAKPALPSPYVVNDSRVGTGLFRFEYQGSGWISGAEATAYQNDNYYSRQAGDTCTIRFEGARLKYYGAKAPAHGIAAFSIDGGEEAKVDCYSGSRNGNALLFDTGVLEPGQHVLAVRVTGEKNGSASDAYINVDRVEISTGAEGAAFNDTMTGDGEHQFHYTGTWHTSNDSACYEGDNYWSNDIGAALSFRFNGTSLKYYSTRNRNIGIAAFSIDNGQEQEIDLYQASKEDQALVYQVEGLEPGQHTLRVRVTGKKNSAATDWVIVADKIEVQDEANGADDHSQTAEWNKKEATGTEPGYTGDKYCVVCGKKVADGEVIPATGGSHTEHVWDQGTVAKQPTATEKGERVFTCTVCGATRTEEIPATGGSGKPAPGKPPKKGDILRDASSKGLYKVASVKTANGKTTGTVSYQKPGNASAKTVRIPDQVTIGQITYRVTSIAAKSFQNQKKLAKVTVGGNVKTVGASAFRGCTSLKSIAFGKSVAKIGDSAFYGCTSLKSVVLGKNVASVGAGAFGGCANLKAVKMGSKVKAVGSSAFSGCKKLSSVTLGKNVSSLGAKSFYQCTSLKKITIPSKVTKIGRQAFDGCRSLKNITIQTKKLTSKTIGSSAFRKISGKAVVKVPKGKWKAYRGILQKRGLGKKAKVMK